MNIVIVNLLIIRDLAGLQNNNKDELQDGIHHPEFVHDYVGLK